MKFSRTYRVGAAGRAAIFGIVLALAPALFAIDAGLPEKTPESLGFSATRLERVPALLKHEIDAKHYAGAVWLVARDGAVVSHGAVGMADVAAGRAMTEDAVFRMFSMTKIVTTVTALTLLEEGKIDLDDPVERYVPELAKRPVFVGGTADAPQLEPAKGSITIRHLLTQSSGLVYDIFAEGELGKLWLGADIWGSRSLKDFVGRIAKLPLAHQPGTKWTYGVNTDVLGAVIEAVTGQELETAMRERVLAPLGMMETTFRPGAELQARSATIYHRAAGGGFERDEHVTKLGTLRFSSGGGGLFSTLHDYARFAQMLLKGGELDGVRVLGRKTVELMTSDQTSQLPAGIFFKPPAFGFGVRVRTPASGAAALGSPGMFGWEGLATTSVSMDPKEHVLLIVLLQHAPFDEDQIFTRFANTAYQALGR